MLGFFFLVRANLSASISLYYKCFSSLGIQDQSQIRRREALFQTAFATFSLPTIAPLALAETGNPCNFFAQH